MPERPPHPLAVWLADHARPILLREMTANNCIESTAAALDVLRSHGVRCRELPVELTIFNAAAWQFIKRGMLLRDADGRPVRENETAWDLAGAWSVGLGMDRDQVPTPGKYGGHLVALVEECWLLDLSIDQAQRLHRGITIDEPILCRADPAQLADGWQEYGGPDGQVVMYRLNHSIWAGAYKRARPWRDRAQRKQLADEIEAAYRARPREEHA